jgi:HK97 family phage major capsid protein
VSTARLLGPDFEGRLRDALDGYGHGERHVRLASESEFGDWLRLRTTVDASNSVPTLQRFTDFALGAAKGGRVLPRATVVPMTSNVIAVSKEVSRTEAAAPTPFGTALPEAAIGWTDSDEPARRVGVWVPVTRGAWNDRGFVREMVRQLLEDDFLRVVDAGLISGDGTGESLNGILNGGIPSQALAADTHATALVKAAATVRAAGHVGPIDVLANAADLQDVALASDFEPRLLALREVLGVRDFVPVPTLSAGTIIVGDVAAGLHVYPRSGLDVTVSDSHDDFFVIGKVAVLAEARLASKVVRPSAFVKITGA